MSAISLAGKRMLVTGAAGGVGRALVGRLLQEKARLVLTDRDGDKLESLARAFSGYPDLALHPADLSRSAEVEAVFAKVDSVLGGLDALVACAGVGSDPLMAFADDSWREVIESNLLSYVACTQKAVARLREAERGAASIVLLGSISVHIKAVGESVYNAAKGGVAAFAETLRKELIPDAIRVTLIEPGAIGTAMQPFDPADRARRIAEHELLPPEEVADAVLFALSRPAGVDCVTLRIEPMNQKIV